MSLLMSLGHMQSSLARDQLAKELYIAAKDHFFCQGDAHRAGESGFLEDMATSGAHIWARPGFKPVRGRCPETLSKVPAIHGAETKMFFIVIAFHLFS